MSNNAELIKDLRNKTGAGFLDCKSALLENNNNLESAIEYLRKKGLAKASKKTSREAVEGAVALYLNDDLVVILKVNTETDFAAKSETFLNFLDEIGNIILEINDPDMNIKSFLSFNYKNNNMNDYINNMIAKIGENIVLSELIILEKQDYHFSHYVHNSYKNNVGKIIALITYNANQIDDKIINLSKNICMHIAAMKPESLDVDNLDQNLIEKEKEVQKELIINSGKPSNIVDKILDGKMKKFYSDVTLYNQSYILDADKNVKDIINEHNSYEFALIDYKIVSL